MPRSVSVRFRLVFAFLFAVASCWGAPEDTFEVASVKPSPPLPRGMAAGLAEALRSGEKVSESRASFTRRPLKALIARAYRVEPFQVSGPEWIDAAEFDIVATLPKGVAVAAVPEMLRNLLIERFALKTHLTPKQTQCYVLELGSEGLTLGTSASDLTAEERKTVALMNTGSLVSLLSDVLGYPVLDRTGLVGPHRFPRDLWSGLVSRRVWKMSGEQAQVEEVISVPSEGEILKAVNAAGLRASFQKLGLTTVVIDQVEKMPTEN